MVNLIRLVYVSRASFEAATQYEGIEPTVARILMQSRLNNPKKEIGGVLYYGNGFFFQCLEGPTDLVNALTGKIMLDDRHRDMQILKATPVTDRLFKNWSMKYIPLEQDISDLLQKFKISHFDPYKFSNELIEEFVSLFCKISDPSQQADQNYQPSAVKKSLWSKLFGIFNKKV